MKQILIPALVLATIATMLLPMPAGILDFLLLSNLVLSLFLLLTALYVPEPVRLSSLPGLLLLLTLFRLSLNISTTRSILSKGSAGQAVETFGELVIGGSPIVGLVIFLIITVVQFVVIAKGAERVAEVSARFTLDAMPGKQMSIDADMRGGLIDFETARRKRHEIQVESRFYGALDGSMKFVKGDAIAGILIAAINIVGGLLVGIFQGGLSPASAANKYLILSVGDGLLAQIPALLNSLAAGMVVTRVVNIEGATLAEELFHQLNSMQSVKYAVAGIAALMGCVPGMPTMVCLVLAAVLLLCAPASTPQPQDGLATVKEFLPKVPATLEIELSADTARLLQEDGAMVAAIEQFRQDVYAESGLFLARPTLNIVRFHDEQGVVIRHRGLLFRRIAPDQPAEMNRALIQGLGDMVRSRKGEIVDDLMTRRILDHFDREAPELVANVVPGLVSITVLTEILRALVQEDVSIKSLDVILQTVAESHGKAAGARALVEEVRIALRRGICSSLVDSEGRMPVITIDSILEVAFIKCECGGDVVDAEMLEVLIGGVETLLAGSDKDAIGVLVVSRKARKLIRECLAARRIECAVLAHEELPEDLELHKVAHIEAGEKFEDRELARVAA
jgi:type III secretion protein V